MKQYDYLAGYYDDVISEKDLTSSYIRSRLKRYSPDAKTLLEFGCGTGDVMSGLAGLYEISGIDSSRRMLRVARKKMPDAELIHGDIRERAVHGKFDAVICVYDTLNHLTLFSHWLKVFRNASRSLNENGLFIFDVNTRYKLEMLSRISPLVHSFGKNLLIMNISRVRSNVFNWNLKVFEHTSGKNYRITETDIEEAVFDKDKITAALSSSFYILKAEDESGGKITSMTERICFVCKKKNSKN